MAAVFLLRSAVEYERLPTVLASNRMAFPMLYFVPMRIPPFHPALFASELFFLTLGILSYGYSAVLADNDI